jgi:alanyl-tRNA synthetase
MQQHTGQHVLSAAFDRLFENATVSFHLGAEACSIDLARETSPAEAERAFAEANRIVFEDRPVSIRFVSEQEASRLPLRKDPARQGLLRLIEIYDFDLSACGGTHVSRTGEIGAIALLGTERIRGGSRVSFACGARALGFFTMYREAVIGSVRILSVLPGELPAAIEKLHGESKDLRKTVGRLQESLAGHEASRLLAGADELQGFKLVAAVLEGWEPQGLKSVASSAVANAARVIVVLVSSSSPASVVIARSTDVALDAGKTLRDLAARFGGKGGGRPELAQGGGFAGAPGEILDAARHVIASAIRT